MIKTKVIPIKGDIVTNEYSGLYDYFGLDYSAPDQVAKSLEEAAGADVDIQINSGGGIVDAGSEIYTALKSYSGKVTVSVVGMAASAASLIAMAGDIVQMSPSATMMIHNVSSATSGDYKAMDNASSMLKEANNAIANAYQLKTRLDHEEILRLMDSTYWLSPQEAIDKGFADKMMFEEQQQLQAVASITSIPSLETLKQFNQTLKPTSDQSELAILMARNRFLTLGGKLNDQD